MRILLIFVLLAGCSNDLVDRMEAEKAKAEEARARAEQAHKLADRAMKDSAEARDKLSKIEKDLGELDAKVNTAVDAVTAAQTQADRDAAKAKLDALRKEKADIEARMVEAKSTAAKAQRVQGVNISEECKANPLAKGCP